MGRSKLLILIFTWMATLPVFGNVNRYMVFFTDKNGSAYSLEYPEDFLSIRSLKRREKQNIKTGSNDLPVSATYLNDLQSINGVDIRFPSKWINGVLVETDESLITDIEALPFVKHVEFVAPGKKFGSSQRKQNGGRLKAVANDPYDGNESKAQNEFIGADVMHQMGYRGEGMLIAVFDSGFDDVDQSSYFRHVFDNDLIVGTRDFVKGSQNVFQYDYHGAKVLSCISGFVEGEYTGTAPQANLVLCVTEDIDTEYRIEEYNWLFAAEYADSIGADVINSSVGYSFFDDDSMDYTYQDLDGKTTVITRAAELAASKGMLVVSSMGNEGNDPWQYLNAPADGDSVFSIGAVTFDKERSNFSSFGPNSAGTIKPDISSLGSWVKIIYKNEIGYANGTSFSAPMVSGLAAGLWQAYPQLTNIEVMQYLKMTASQSEDPDTLIGYGIPNFVKAFNKIKVNEGGVANKFVVFPNPVTNRKVIYFYIDSSIEQTTSKLNFYDLKGSYIRSKDFAVNGNSDPIEFDVSFLTPGTYLLTYEIGGDLKKSKLVIQ